jgi:hypothetical protein
MEKTQEGTEFNLIAILDYPEAQLKIGLESATDSFSLYSA